LPKQEPSASAFAIETEEGEDLILVPLLNGRAAIDRAYQLSRADDNSMFGFSSTLNSLLP
jgi:hypothetical protein